MDLHKQVDLEQFHEELSIIRHLEKMDIHAGTKQTRAEDSSEVEAE